MNEGIQLSQVDGHPGIPDFVKKSPFLKRAQEIHEVADSPVNRYHTWGARGRHHEPTKDELTTHLLVYGDRKIFTGQAAAG